MESSEQVAIKDWKNNEVKEGMIIYFVQTKPGLLESGRTGLMMPGSGSTIWEDEKKWLERKNKEMWDLGEEMLVEQDEGGRLVVNTITKGANELEGYTFHSKIDLLMQQKWSPNLTIAIKGISDKK